MKKGIIVFAIKDEEGRLLELYNKTSEEFLDEIFWDNPNREAQVYFDKVMVKKDNKINFYAEIKKNEEL